MRWLAGFLLLTGLTDAVDAQIAPQQSPRMPPPAVKLKPAAPAADPAYDAAKSAFEALPEAVRKTVQDALVWTGDYNAVTAGTFGRRTYDGIAAWQRRTGAEPSGILSPTQRTALDAAGETARKAARFKVEGEAASGIVLGVPENLFTKRAPQPGGSRWQSADGRVTLDTKSFKPGETDLDALFERVTAQGGDRIITYKVKKPDFIVVTGETVKGRFYIRYAAGASGIRGFTVGYDKARAPEVDRLVIAIANSFLPFPEAPAPAEAASAAKPPMPAAMIAAPARPSASGFVVAPGRVLTSAAALQGCASPTVAGHAAAPAKRDATGILAILDVGPGRTRPSVLPAVRTDGLKPDEPLVVVQAEPRGPASVAPGTAGTSGVYAPLQPGAAGAAVLDRSGRLVGLVERFPEAPRLVAGIVPPTRYGMVPASALAAFLVEAGFAAGSGKAAASGTLGEAAAPVIDAVVAIECGR